ncbi:T9SS type A sorting domain-containing protein, partial [candidate division FCPU426 bacterium]|nr:T9SS type A sorting domain-containing protein [candidate division FCPU426 bacterium]
GTTMPATYTPTSTMSPTPYGTTMTATFTRTSTISPTPYGTTMTATFTRTETVTSTPTESISVESPTITSTPYGTTMTATFTRTATITPTQIPGEISPTITPTIIPTPVLSPTLEANTPVVMATPTITPTLFVKMPTKEAPVVIRQNVIKPSQSQPAQFSVQLDRAQHVTINIYTISGKLVKTVADRMADAGTFEEVWNGANKNGRIVSSGVYIVHIKTETFSEKRKIAVVR